MNESVRTTPESPGTIRSVTVGRRSDGVIMLTFRVRDPEGKSIEIAMPDTLAVWLQNELTRALTL